MLAPIDVGQQVEFEKATADDVAAMIAAEIEEALIGADIALVRHADDDRGCGIGLEHRLEPVLRVEALRHVVDDQRQAVGFAAIVVHRDVSHLMDPARRVAAERRDLYDQVGEALAREQAHERIFTARQAALVAVAQAEALRIIVRRGAQILDPVDAVHFQRSGIGAEDDAGRVHQNDAGEQTFHQLLEMMERGTVNGAICARDHRVEAQDSAASSLSSAAIYQSC